MSRAVAIGVAAVVVVMVVGQGTGQECGKQTIRNGRIVGGEDAFEGEFPFLVSIRLGGNLFGQHHCGGAILKKLWVLTAAHCVTSYSKNSYVIRVGEYDLTKAGSNHTEADYSVEKIVIHPEYHQPKRYNNDIALLKLRNPISYDSYVWPVCSPETEDDFTGHLGTAVGWGYTEENAGRRSSILQKVQVPIMNRTQCQQLYEEAKKMKMKFQSGQICAGHREGKKDSCQVTTTGSSKNSTFCSALFPKLMKVEPGFLQEYHSWEGDSGGPLVMKRDGHYTVVGVVSAGYGCARSLLPGIYSSVPYHMKWIKETTESP